MGRRSLIRREFEHHAALVHQVRARQAHLAGLSGVYWAGTNIQYLRTVLLMMRLRNEKGPSSRP